MKIRSDSLTIRSIPAFVTLLLTLLAGCGGGGGDPPPVSYQWIWDVSSRIVDSSVHLTGKAWVSRSYVALNCSGLACLSDRSTTSFPGVSVTYHNLTTGDQGSAVSRYGGGTEWEHLWEAVVPLSAGENVIVLKAYDPASTGGEIVQRIVR